MTTSYPSPPKVSTRPRSARGTFSTSSGGPSITAWRPIRGGYIQRWNGHQRRNELQHRVVIAEQLGRPLLPSENVHHRNGDRADNRLENLELWSTTQPSGQRVEDKVEWAVELLRLYAPALLA
ncbi:HNH endonuclease [Microbacterium lacus]